MKLQWGRGFEAAETICPASSRISDTGLQWGRGFEAAETVHDQREDSRRAGFNGAAVLRPRKHSDLPRPF